MFLQNSEQSNRSVSVSELKKFIKCTLLWYFSSAPPRGLGLVSVGMEQDALVFGRLTHEVLEEGYNGDRNFTDIYVSKMAPLMPSSTSLFKNQIGSFNKLLETGKVMMSGYEDWSTIEDAKFKFLATETKWKDIPLPGIDGTMSAIIDAVILRPDGLWLLDYKTTSSADNPWTTQDLQATVYTYAARRVIDPAIKGIIFRFLLKKAPWTFDKLLLKDLSVTKRKNIANLTTYREYKRAISISTLMTLAANGWKKKNFHDKMTVYDYANLTDKLVARKHTEFMEHFLGNQRFYNDQLQILKYTKQGYYWDVEVPRTNIEIGNYMNHLILPKMEELHDLRVIGPTGLANAWNNCGRCMFREPCRVSMQGGDYESVLNNNYVVSDHYLEEVEV